jgi:hypothetical protein
MSRAPLRAQTTDFHGQRLPKIQVWIYALRSSLLSEIALTISIALTLHSLAGNGSLGLQAIMMALGEVVT